MMQKAYSMTEGPEPVQEMQPAVFFPEAQRLSQRGFLIAIQHVPLYKGLHIQAELLFCALPSLIFLTSGLTFA